MTSIIQTETLERIRNNIEAARDVLGFVANPPNSEA